MKKKIWLLTAALVVVIGLGTSFFYADAFMGAEKEQSQPTEKKGSEVSVEESSPESEEKQATYNPDQVVKNISYYPVKATNKKKIERNHSEAIQITKKIANNKKLDLKTDLDDPQYRDYIIGLATDLESQPKEDTEKIIELAKDLADYESNQKNKEIKKYEEKLNKGQELTDDEVAELDNLLPIKKGTPVTKPETPVKKGPELEEDNDQDKNKSEEEPKDPENNQDSSEAEAEEGSDPNQQPEAPEPSHPEPDPKNSDQEDNEKPKEEPDPAENQDKPKVSNGYDRSAAREYAYQWWDKRNNEKYGYYSRVSGGCYACWYDCTNFVSQTLQAGGMVEWKKTSYWYYSDQKPSYSWGVSNSFYKHFEVRAKPVKKLTDLQVGDVVQADINGDGHINHAAIVTKVTPTEVYVTQHTTDRKDYPISTWFRAGYTVYGWDMEEANFPDPGK